MSTLRSTGCLLELLRRATSSQSSARRSLWHEAKFALSSMRHGLIDLTRPATRRCTRRTCSPCENHSKQKGHVCGSASEPRPKSLHIAKIWASFVFATEIPYRLLLIHIVALFQNSTNSTSNCCITQTSLSHLLKPTNDACRVYERQWFDLKKTRNLQWISMCIFTNFPRISLLSDIN